MPWLRNLQKIRQSSIWVTSVEGKKFANFEHDFKGIVEKIYTLIVGLDY